MFSRWRPRSSSSSWVACRTRSIWLVCGGPGSSDGSERRAIVRDAHPASPLELAISAFASIQRSPEEGAGRPLGRLLRRPDLPHHARVVAHAPVLDDAPVVGE